MGNEITGIASEFYVLSMLLRKGADATLTLGNKKNIDIIFCIFFDFGYKGTAFFLNNKITIKNYTPVRRSATLYANIKK